MSEPKTVTIPAELYKELMESHELLQALRQGGVENWEWYDESVMNYLK